MIPHIGTSTVPNEGVLSVVLPHCIFQIAISKHTLILSEYYKSTMCILNGSDSKNHSTNAIFSSFNLYCSKIKPIFVCVVPNNWHRTPTNQTIMKHFLLTLIAFSMVAISFGQEPEACTNYKVYYIHIPGEGGDVVLYEVEIADGAATLTALETLPTSAHLGISSEGDLYIVSSGGKLAIYDPSTGTNTAPVQITLDGEPLTGIPHVVVDQSDDVLYVASSNTNSVYSVDVSTAEATLVAALDVNVRGGDLVVTQDGTLWLVNRPDNTFYNITDGGVPGFTVGLNGINGAAVLEDGTIIVANSGSTAFNLIDPATGDVLEATLEAGITFNHGDLAAGCVSGEPSSEPCFVSEILEVNQGVQLNGNPVAANRSDPSVIIGEPSASNAPGSFFSLGYILDESGAVIGGGSVTVGFGAAIYDGPGPDMIIYETSFSGNNCGASDDEFADIELSQDGINFVFAETICRNGEIDIADTGLEYVIAVRVTNSTITTTPDGWDFDGIETLQPCEPIPQLDIIPGDCYATEVIEYVQGTRSNGNALAANRTDATQALGEPERTDEMVFVTLGYGGSITLGFSGPVLNLEGDDLEIVETSFGNAGCAAYPEYADVYVSVDGEEFFFARTVCKSDPFVEIDDAGDFAFINYVKIVNNDELSTTFDAYDLDGVVAIHNCEEEEIESAAIASENTLLDSTYDLPHDLNLFPNPSAGVTNVVFRTAENGRATLEIVDLSGRVIESLFNQEVNEGQEYRLNFDGSRLPHGIYIAKLITGNQLTVKKLMINR